jgi:cytochrome c peroxidase
LNLFNGKAQCNSCHRETLLSAATHENIDKLGVSIKRFQADNREAFLDTGFFNIGVRPTRENLGIGGLTPFGTPLSSTRTLRAGERMAIDGAFKAPGLRNVALTGPYMHNGGLLTLDQVLDFYQTKGDFFSQNFKDININLVNVDFDDEEQDDLEEFLRVGLTDPRVLDEKAPFDHPELEIPHGTGRRRSELYELVPSVGAKGRKAQGLPPIELPMGLPLPGSRD